jgi:hypothetical protein
MAELKFENVWGSKSDSLVEEIVATWESLGALPPESDPYRRAQQVVFVIRTQEDKIVGISTAFNVFIEQLKSNMIAFRGLILPGYRLPGLLIKLVNETFNHLESVQSQFKPQPLGVVVEVENPNLLRIKKAVTATGLTFIGFSKKGFPIRIKYFKNAEIKYDIQLPGSSG